VYVVTVVLAVTMVGTKPKNPENVSVKKAVETKGCVVICSF